MQAIKDRFVEIDRQWPREPARKIRLSFIGCGALMLQANYERGTKDSDVFHRVEPDMLGVAESEIELPSWI